MTAVSAEAPGEDRWSPMPDMSGLPLVALSATTPGVLGRSLRQVLGTLADRDGVISAFGSFVAED